MGLFDDVTTDMMEFGGGADWYPKGEYEVVIEAIHMQDLPSTNDDEPFRGYVTTEGEQLSVQFGEFTAVNGADAPPGNNKMFLKVVLADGVMDVYEVEPKDDLYVELAKGKRRLASLAAALDVTEGSAQDFVTDLRNGVYNGSRLGSNWVRWTRGNPKSDDFKQGSYPSKFTSITMDIG